MIIGLELNKIIFELLASNSFVSLPGLGSFTQTYQPATLSPDGKSFLPPKHTIAFDTKRIFNDEVLEQFLQDKLGFVRSDAAELVERFVLKVKSGLSNGEKIVFEKVGHIYEDSDGNIAFHEADEAERISATFGLKSVNVDSKMLKEKQPSDILKARESSKTDTFFVHTKMENRASQPIVIDQKSWIFGAIAAIVVAILIVSGLLLIFPDFQPGKQANSSANLIKKEIETTESQPYKLPESNVPNVDEIEMIEINKEDETEKVRIETDKKKALFYQEPAGDDGKTYYLISGSFEKEENAHLHFNNLEKQGYSPEIIRSNGRFRVAMRKFSNRNSAILELERIRKETSYESVWLLGL